MILRMFAPVGFARETFFHAEKTIERVAKLHNQERSAAAALRRDVVIYFTGWVQVFCKEYRTYANM